MVTMSEALRYPHMRQYYHGDLMEDAATHIDTTEVFDTYEMYDTIQNIKGLVSKLELDDVIDTLVDGVDDIDTYAQDAIEKALPMLKTIANDFEVKYNKIVELLKRAEEILEEAE